MRFNQKNCYFFGGMLLNSHQPSCPWSDCSQMMSTMEANIFVRSFATILMALTNGILLATTIVPYANLGSLADRSDAMVMARVIKSYEYFENGQIRFRYQLIVEENLKGSLQKGEEFVVQKWEKMIDERWITMWGDLNFHANATYLLFLEHQGENIYHPLCFSYYVFEEIKKNGETYIVPSPEAREFELVDLNEAEPLYIYRKKPLLKQLTDYVSGVKGWSSDGARTNVKPEAFILSGYDRSAPESCSFLTVSQRKLRWNNSPGQGVKIYYNETEATGCSSSIDQVQQAISDISDAYQGIEISSGGSASFTPNCSDGTAVGPDFRGFMDANLGGFRNVIIQFDDPCSEISDLTFCGGILALGGTYGVGTHRFQNETWATAKYGYVILNDGVGACKCNKLRQILSHELTHSLGLGHISGAFGAANMNPDCCRSISSIDRTCVDYAYPPQNTSNVRPVELPNFEVLPEQVSYKTQWKTPHEQNVERIFNINGNNLHEEFQSGGQIAFPVHNEYGHEHQSNDINPYSESHHRWRSIDHVAAGELTNKVLVKRNELERPQIYPTIVNDLISVRIPDLQNETTIQIFSMSGKQIGSKKHDLDFTQLAVDFLPSGWYYLQIKNKQYCEMFKFYKV